LSDIMRRILAAKRVEVHASRDRVRRRKSSGAPRVPMRRAASSALCGRRSPPADRA
jgi:hypothetical protein